MRRFLRDVVQSWCGRPFIGFLALLLLGCTSTKTFDDRALLEQLTPAEWRQPGIWYFDVVDNEQRSIGYIVLQLTGEDVGSDTCMDSYWKSAIVLDNSLDFDFEGNVVPAYSVRGSNLIVELTASSCSVHHRFVGEATSEGATGGFHYLHSLNARIVGAFAASSVLE